MKKTKIAALLLSGIMLCSVFTSCNKIKPGKSLGKIDGKQIDTEMFEAYARSQLSMFQSQGADETQLREMLEKDIQDGKKGKDMIKDQVIGYFKNEAAIERLAKENNISLSKEDEKALKTEKDTQIEQMGGRAKFVDALKQQHMSEELFDSRTRFMKLQQKVYNALFNKGGKFAPDENKIIESVSKENVRVKHILVQGKKDDKDYADKKKKATSILARVQKGEDFDALLKEFGEDPGMERETEGYIFNKDGVLVDDASTTFDKIFTAESFKIQANQVSPVVVTDFGLHIIKRLPLDTQYVTKNIDKFYETFSMNAFQTKITEISKDIKVELSDEYNNFDLAGLIEPLKQQAPAGSAQGGTNAPATAPQQQ